VSDPESIQAPDSSEAGRAGKAEFRLNVLAAGSAEAANMLLRFLAGVVVARQLGAEGRGVYALALAAPALMLGLTNIGLGEATTVLIGKKKYSAERVVGSMNFLMLLMLLLGFAVYFGLSPLILKALHHEMPEDIYLLAFCIFPLTLYWGGNAAVALGLSMVRRVSWGRLLNNSVFCALVFALLARGLTVKAVLIAFIFSFVAENAYLLYSIRKETGITIRLDPEVIKDQISLGWHVFWGGMFLQVARRLDIFLVNFFAGAGPLGLYAVAYSVAELVLAVPGIYSRAALSSAAVAGKGSGFRVSNAAIRQSLFLMAALAVGVALVMRPFILKAYTSEFLPAVLPALILLPGVVLMGLSNLLGTIFTGYARPQELARSAAIACAATIALDFLLIPRYGIVGAAAASTAAYGAGAVWIFFSYLKYSGAGPREVLLAGKEDLNDYRETLRGLFVRKGK